MSHLHPYQSVWNAATGSYEPASQSAAAPVLKASRIQRKPKQGAHLAPVSHALALEQRIVFDGAALASADLMLDRDTSASYERDQVRQAQADQRPEPVLQQSGQQRVEIVFIDSSVANIAGQFNLPNAEYHVIAGGRDGLAQMADVLRGRSDIDAIHIVSHGSSGELRLGGGVINLADLRDTAHAADLAAISEALSAEADILLYGCDVASGSVGQAFINQLAAATGADVAASTDDTGAAARGGDWQLERQTGAIEAQALAAAGWDHLLAPPNAANDTLVPNFVGVTDLINLLANDTDPDGGALTITSFTIDGNTYAADGSTVTIANYGDFSLTSSGQFSFTASFNFPEEFRPIPTITYEIEDDEGLTDTASLTLLTDLNSTVTITEDTIYDFTATDFGNLIASAGIYPLLLTISPGGHFYQPYIDPVTSADIGLQPAVVSNFQQLIFNNTGDAKFVPHPNFTGTVYLDFVIDTDGNAVESNFRITINVIPVNDAPVLVQESALNLVSDGSFESSGTGWISDTGTIGISDPADLGVIASPDSGMVLEVERPGSVESSYIEQGVPTVAGQTYTFSLEAITRAGNTADMMVLSVDGVVIGRFSTTDQWADYSASFTATSANSIVRITSIGSQAGPAILGIDGAGLVIDNVRVQSTNAMTSFNGEPAGVAVYNPPVASDVDDTQLESATVVITNALAGDTLEGLSGLPGGITAVLSSGAGTVTVELTGSASLADYQDALAQLRFNTSSTDTTNRSVTITVNDGDVNSNAVTTLINIPFPDADETLTVDEDSGITNGNLLTGTSSPDGPVSIASFSIAGETGTFTLGSAYSISGVGSLTVSSDGSYSFTPAAHYNGTVPVISYQVTDGSGTDDTSTLSITVTPVNDNFTDANETLSIAEDSGTSSGNLLTGTTSVDGPVSIASFSIAGETGTFTLGSAYSISGVGSLTVSSDGSYSFTPAAHYNGTVPVISYQVTDGSGTDDTSTLSITVMPVIDPLVDADETLTLAINSGAHTGSLLTGTASVEGAVSVTGFSIDGRSGTLGTPFVIDGIGRLTVSSDGRYSFMPVADYYGRVPLISYQLSDGSSTDNSTLSITVTPPAPVTALIAPRQTQEVLTEVSPLARIPVSDSSTLHVSIAVNQSQIERSLLGDVGTLGAELPYDMFAGITQQSLQGERVSQRSDSPALLTDPPRGFTSGFVPALHVQNAVRYQLPVPADLNLFVQQSVRESQIQAQVIAAKIEAQRAQSPGLASLLSSFSMDGAILVPEAAPLKLAAADTQDATDARVIEVAKATSKPATDWNQGPAKAEPVVQQISKDAAEEMTKEVTKEMTKEVTKEIKPLVIRPTAILAAHPPGERLHAQLQREAHAKFGGRPLARPTSAL
jgi:Domain of unknown function (DUF4347)/Bacterial Ig domain/Bacterial Ig-like domain